MGQSHILTFFYFTYVSFHEFLFHFQRFGCALVNTGQLNLKQKQFETDLNPIDKDCTCSTCKTYTRAYLHCIVTAETVACHLISVHNIAFQVI